MANILTWDIYEITTETSSIQGVMLRGRVRKYSLKNQITILLENASDRDNTVRFALPAGDNPETVINFTKTLAQDAEITLKQESLPNPVLSKMKVNNEDRYTI